MLYFLFFGMIILVGILAPTTPRAKDYLLFSKYQKDSLLMKTEEPRIIFIGGSNLIYGLNSETIKDSFDMNPVNAVSFVSVGLIFMMDNTLEYVKKGDIVVMAPEYQHFFGRFAYGGNDLFRLLFDVDMSEFSQLRLKHYFNLIKPIPSYFVSKLNPSHYFNVQKDSVHGADIFNEYGDSSSHWKLGKRPFPVMNPIKGKLNKSIIREIEVFKTKLNNKGVELVITFPVIQDASFDINQVQISKVYEELKKSDLKIISDPENYKLPDSLMFDQPYHPLKTGVDIRTNRLITDLQFLTSN